MVFSSAGYSQRFIGDVTIDAPRLDPAYQKDADELQRTLVQYINSNSFSEEAYDYDLKFRVQVFIENVDVSGSEKMFHCQAVFTNDYDQRFLEGAWKFPFTSGEAIDRNGIFHPLPGMIDYYGFLIIAGELDGMELNGGSGSYEKASQVADLALSSSRWSYGWSGRQKLLREMVGNYRLREARLRWNEAFWFIEENDILKSRKSLSSALDNLKEIVDYKSKDKFTRGFIDYHYKDADYFQQAYQDTFFLPALRFLSPENAAYFDMLADKFSNR